LGGFFELFLSISQLSARHSLQGAWYYPGERSFSIFTPGIAKAYFLGREFLRPYGTFSHPNSMGGFYLLVFTFVLTQKRITHPVIKITLLFVSSALVLVSFSRTAIIGYVLINILYFARTFATCKTCFFAKVTIGFFLILFTFGISGDLNSLKKRTDFVEKSVSIISQKPFTGTGIGSYLIAQHQYPQKFVPFFEQPVHNIFLLIIAQLGIPLSLLLIALIIQIIRVEIKNISFLLPLLVVILTGCMDHYWLTLQQNMLVLAVISGILFSYEKKTS
jgi:O-antigen ligase